MVETREDEADSQSALEEVYVLLRAQTGHDFFYYKRSTIQRRVERRMALHRLSSIEQYVTRLRESPLEIELLFKELLIGVTSFFRDPEAWKTLHEQVLPRLIARHSGDGPLRAWVAGCSSGEEAYSLAIAFREAAERLEAVPGLRIQIFATDLDCQAIEKARAGVYPQNITADVSPERLRRFFIREDAVYRVNPEVRELVVFAPHNMIMDPPFTRLDLLCCRNFLIYLSAGLQKKIVPVFHYCLKPDGALFLGSAETVDSSSKLFQAFDSESRIYRSVAQPAVVRPFEVQCALQLASGAARLRTTPRGAGGETSVASARILELEQELLCAREQVQTTREEMLRSGQELEAVNARLRSKNEELITTQEELRSLNEELQAVNQELQARLDELQQSS